MPTVYDARIYSDHTFVLANNHSAKPAKSSPRNTDDVFGRDRRVIPTSGMNYALSVTILKTAMAIEGLMNGINAV